MKRRQVMGAGQGLLMFLMMGFLGCASPSGQAGNGAPTPEAAPSPEPEAAPQETPEPEAAAVGALHTAAQADRGAEVYESVCSECHTTSEFRGRGFQADWGRRSVYSFYRTVRSTMPDDNPGGLEDQVYLDVVAYILGMNGHGAGADELSADSPMRDVRIDPEMSGSQR
ncbi:MAG: c-type cytochrome [Longimicrobiales bacterium]